MCARVRGHRAARERGYGSGAETWRTRGSVRRESLLLRRNRHGLAASRRRASRRRVRAGLLRCLRRSSMRTGLLSSMLGTKCRLLLLLLHRLLLLLLLLLLVSHHRLLLHRLLLVLLLLLLLHRSVLLWCLQHLARVMASWRSSLRRRPRTLKLSGRNSGPSRARPSLHLRLGVRRTAVCHDDTGRVCSAWRGNRPCSSWRLSNHRTSAGTGAGATSRHSHGTASARCHAAVRHC